MEPVAPDTELRLHWMPRPPDALAIARDWLREIAGGDAARALHRDARGRPRLHAGLGDIGWSHSGDALLLAWVPTGVVGVDIEPRARAVPALRIARRYFADDEVAALAALPDVARDDAFLRLWCAKEALLKAHGHGLSFGLHRLAFDATATAPRLLRCDPALGTASDWRLHALEAEAHVAVVARRDGILPA